MDWARLGMTVDSSGLRKGKKDMAALRSEARDMETGVKGSTKRSGASFTMMAGVIGAAVAAAGGLAGSVGTIAQFDAGMARVAAISGATGEELQMLRDTAREFGSTTEFSATQAADALGFLTMAGFSANEAAAALPATLDLATASALGLGQTADIVSNIMSGFGVAAEDAASVTDILAKTASISNTNVAQLGQAMSYVAPVADTLGISMEQTAAAIGVLGDAGIQGGRAGTALRAMLSKMVKPTSAAETAMKGLGISLAEINPEANSLYDILNTLADGNIGLAEATELVGIEAASNLLLLVEGREKFKEYTGSIEDAENATSDMAKTMRDTLGGDLKGFGSAMEGLVLSIGEAGFTQMVRDIVQGATSIVRAISKWEHLDVALKVLGGVGAGIAAIAFPMVAGAAAIGAAGAYIYQNWEDLRVAFPNAAAALDAGAALAGRAVTWVKDAVKGLGPTFDEMTSGVKAAMSGDWDAAWEHGKAAVDNFVIWWEGLDFGFSPEVSQGISDFFSGYSETISTYFEPMAARIKTAWDQVGPIMENIRDIGNSLADIFNQSVDGDNVYASLGTFLGDVVGFVGSGVALFIEGVARAITAITGAVAGALSGDWDRFTTSFRDFFDWAGSLVGVPDWMSNLSFSGMFDGIDVTAAVNFFKGVFDFEWADVMPTFEWTDIFPDFGEIGKMFDGFFDAESMGQNGIDLARNQIAMPGLDPATASELLSVLDQIESGAIEAGAAVEQITANMENGIDSLVRGSVAKTIQEAFGVSGEGMPDLSAGIAEVAALDQTISDVEARAKALPATINAAATAVDQMAVAVASITAAIEQEAAQWEPAMTQAAGSAVSSAASTISGMTGEMHSAGAVIGSAMMDGMAEGIESRIDVVIEKAKGAADAAATAARSALEIHSPSRVFKKIGSQTVDGFVEGLEENGFKVNERVRGMLADAASQSGVALGEGFKVADDPFQSALGGAKEFDKVMASIDASFDPEKAARFKDALGGVGKQMEDPNFQSFQGHIQKISSALVQAAMNGEDMGEALRQTILQIVTDIITSNITNLISQAFAPAIGGISSVGASSAGSVATRSFAGGGKTWSGPRSGGLDGNGGRLALMHPDETVIDNKQERARGGQGQGAGTINVYNENSSQVETQDNEDGGFDVRIMDEAINDYFNRGRGDRVMRNRFGSRVTSKGR